MLYRNGWGPVLGVLAGVLMYLSGTKPLMEWGYYEWLAALGFVVSTLSAQMGWSLLPKKPDGAGVDLKRFIGGGVVLLAAIGLPSCAGHVPPNAAPETKVAIYAADAMAGVREVQRVTAALEAGKVLTEAQAATIMATAHKIGKAGESLSLALKVYHAASDLAQKKLALADALRLLDAIDADLKTLLAPLDTSGEKAHYIDLVTGIVKNLWTVRAMLPVGV